MLKRLRRELAIAGLLTIVVGSAGSCAPSGCYGYISSALDSLRAGLTRESLQCLKEALACDAEEPLAHIALGLTFLAGNRADDALTEFDVALDLDPACAEAIYGRGLVSLSKGQLGPAAAAFCEAQSANVELDARPAIEYVKALGANGSEADSSASSDGLRQLRSPKQLDMGADESLKAVNAFRLTTRGRYAEARPIWVDLQRESAGVDFGERIGCAMTFVKSSPLAIRGWPITEKYRSPSARKSELPVVSGKLILKADLRKADGVRLVAFHVDNKLVAVTNMPPFHYEWDTTRVADGPHKIKVEGNDADGMVICEKTTDVNVRNNDSARRAGRVRDKEAEGLWKRLWEAMRLRPSSAAVNYNLALCALNGGDPYAADAALERAMAADPAYLDAAGRLAGLRQLRGPKQVDEGKLYSVSTDRKVMAITFDDGPKENTAELLDALDKAGVKATFFVVGKQVQAHPDMLKRMHDAGHEIQIHTFNHRALDRLSGPEIEQEIFGTAAAIRSITGTAPRFVRPPGGRVGPKLAETVAKFGMTTVLWTASCGQVEGTNPEKFLSFAVGSARPGAILHMHNAERITLTALPRVIDALRKKGYEFATLSELIALGK